MKRTVKVIPCLDMNEGRVVKGVKFEGLRDAGDPVALARSYSEQGADEITFLDVSASSRGRRTMDEIISEASQGISTPIIVGGGIGSLEEAQRLHDLGAATVSVNTAALRNPALLDEISSALGSQALMVSLDVKTNPEGQEPHFEITTHGGRQGTGIDAIVWAQEVEKRGAGAVMVNSIAQDGVQEGYDLELLRAIRDAVQIDVVASGGAGSVGDFVEAAEVGADAVLAASVFHYGTVTVPEVKEALRDAGFDVSSVDK